MCSFTFGNLSVFNANTWFLSNILILLVTQFLHWDLGTFKGLLKYFFHYCSVLVHCNYSAVSCSVLIK